MMLEPQQNRYQFVVKSFIYSIICLLYLYISDYYHIDLYIQNYFYNFDIHSWIIDKDNNYIRFILYYGLKYTIMIFGIFLIFYLIFSVWSKKNSTHIKAIAFLLVCIIAIPSLVASLKWLTGIPCPSRLQLYGGPLPYEGLFAFHWPGSGASRPACFPAGHPSGGFALLALPMVISRKMLATLAALVTGLLMSFYQMAVGAHFLSHCVATLLFSLAFINACFFLFVSFPSVRWRNMPLSPHG